ncbi:unnamed protein product [Ranitomeya imitator]|uniref:Uncharacterized protein n=1 Tax=Ranitomeya imitator TaxID=111125 RepID=A0ABN9M7S4_9NEOB|nr:unnamed protein product [Ranitomeya imitator]
MLLPYKKKNTILTYRPAPLQVCLQENGAGKHKLRRRRFRQQESAPAQSVLSGAIFLNTHSGSSACDWTLSQQRSRRRSRTQRWNGGQFKSSVGIFSRSSENEYSWLRNLLESQDFGKIEPVYSCCISNNGFSRFCDEVSQCKFGILYHSKNRGRVNLTDVTDSLYDEELEHLSSTLGKENVVVVIDDLDDDGDAVKNTILCSQPKIENLAQDLILVRSASPEEKKRRAKDGLKTVLH